ncbi:MAG: DUF2505 domain-containing protein [Actinomycetia bacterium]|nr:DUF2505 domain-containing protein [Actinomycetes bacterium]MCH9702892.1 DUF2505 domain-containing protein [Actinomycetes bacterium]MCH9759966.1 DUF2505 domain-containing protein [Actinomycetes bacterium]
MPCSFDVTAEAVAGVAEVQKALRDRAYWLARLAKYGGDSMTLESLEVGDDGTTVVHTIQDLRGHMLPGGIGRLLPGDTQIMRTESWRSATDGGQVHGHFTISARGVPSSGSGTMVLKPTRADPALGSSLRIRGTIEVRVPLVGGRIERYITDLVAEEVPQMHRFTAEWIAREA